MQLLDFSNKHVLVVGDVMLDCYWDGQATRISPEAPVPVVKIKGQRQVPGGAANVAMNIAALGANVTLIGAVGHDEAAMTLRIQLESKGIHFLPIVTQAPTTLKWRVLSHHQQLIRLDFEEQQSATVLDAALLDMMKSVPDADLVVFSDYGKGVLSNAAQLIEVAKQQGKTVFVDPKTSDYRHYHGARVITPNWKEFEQVVGPVTSEDDMLEKARALIAAHALEALLITRGEAGMVLITLEDIFYFKASAREVFDVTGAGDTVLAVFTTSVAAGATLAQAAQWANIAAGLVVAKLGTATVSYEELNHALTHTDSEKIVSKPQLLQEVARAKAAGKRIVMTNGCFDILHAGHVQYLTQAKHLGDYLIIAVNDDDSVRQLKGSSRPLNTLADRMVILAAMSAVTWVVSFAEETPAELIGAVLPDVLVKGGDYTVTQIAGHAAVLANGGTVEILPFKPGCSTTGLVERIAHKS
jgi:D-beta-D-heptose 7-phosphate kinase/D-beta-D-heptose 1-phosphate adenosyltransferase